MADIDATSLVLDIDEFEEASAVITNTYCIDFVNGRISGMVDGLEAVKQAITKILLTERFKNLIYSDEYGCEIKDTLMSAGYTDEFLEVVIPALIEEALMVDERIFAVRNFEIKFAEHTIDGTLIKFDVSTIYGDMTMEEVI